MLVIIMILIAKVLILQELHWYIIIILFVVDLVMVVQLIIHRLTKTIAGQQPLLQICQWRNDLLKTTDRAILSCNNAACLHVSDTTNNGNNTIDTGNTSIYLGKAARLLHLKEVIEGCGSEVGTKGTLGNTCNFLMEKTQYSSSSLGTYGPWF